MEIRSETLVSGEMMKRMREAGVDQGYKPVPQKLEREARRVLAGKDVASMDKQFKYRLKRLKVALGNARHENALLKAKDKLRAEGLLK